MKIISGNHTREVPDEIDKSRQREILFSGKVWKTREYFVYCPFFKPKAEDERSAARPQAVLSGASPYKKGAGRMRHSPRCSSRFALRRIFRLFRPTDRRIRRTEPCGPSHDGGPEPCGRWKSPFSGGNREPWNGDGGWADRYASFRIHLLSKYNMLNSLSAAATQIQTDTTVIPVYYNRRTRFGQSFFRSSVSQFSNSGRKRFHPAWKGRDCILPSPARRGWAGNYSVRRRS